MFQSSRKTMKWSSLPKDLGEKVGLSGSQPQPASYLFPSLSLAAEHGGAAGAPESATALGYGSPVSSPARGKHKLELDFKKFWVEFRSSSSEKVSRSTQAFFCCWKSLCDRCGEVENL
ncbi:protein SPIRRIG-like isoform X2 [Musa acuminata AAA Group]|uniref:protein SPIRRIG-like isoform X2 n=1 Tax=Musa acuminata AAA Group TaxID=214697 RepID=UPI0031D30B35